jgi:FkbM family methyltransferase
MLLVTLFGGKKIFVHMSSSEHQENSRNLLHYPHTKTKRNDDIPVPYQHASFHPSILLRDETISKNFRGVYWYDCTPACNALSIPPEVLRVDLFNLGSGKLRFFFALWNDWVAEQWYHHNSMNTRGLWNVNQMARDARYVEPGSVAIDVGTFTGDTTMPLAIAASLTIGFEANPEAFRVIETTAKMNPKHNIHVHQFAVSNQVFTAKWPYQREKSHHSLKEKPETYEVKSIILPDFLKENYESEIINKISYIKIDTEGSDMFILSSMKELLKSMPQRPVIQAEWFIDFSNEQSKDFQNRIDDIGYVPYDVTGKVKLNLAKGMVEEGNRLAEIRNCGELVFPKSHCNFVGDVLLFPIERESELVKHPSINPKQKVWNFMK